jgi:uncharacterized membrane protein HdeD (DUF308 family)
MAKKWIASGTIILLGILILIFSHLKITNLDASLMYLVGSLTILSGIILITFAFGLAISERL